MNILSGFKKEKVGEEGYADLNFRARHASLQEQNLTDLKKTPLMFRGNTHRYGPGASEAIVNRLDDLFSELPEDVEIEVTVRVL